MTDEKQPSERQLAALANIRGFRATFEEVVQRATAARAEFPKDVVANVLAAFAQCEAEVAGTHGETELDTLVERAEELERLRAYVIPKEEIVVEGRSRLLDMSEWSVPGVVVEKLSIEVMPLLASSDEKTARGALRTLYESYDYWDFYIEDHALTMRSIAKRMLALLLLFLTGAVVMLHWGHVYVGVLCAGTAGALLSVVAKLPPVMGYGATNAYNYRILSRIGVGIAASLIGMGLLASDVISIQLPGNVSVADMLDGKDRQSDTDDEHAVDEPEVKAAAPALPQRPTRADAAVPAQDAPPPADDGGLAQRPAMDGGSTEQQAQDRGDTGVGDARASATADAGVTPAAVARGGTPRNSPFSRRAVLLIVALSMLFGFSERALSTFEDKIFPTRVAVAPAPDGGGGGGGDRGGGGGGDRGGGGGVDRGGGGGVDRGGGGGGEPAGAGAGPSPPAPGTTDA